MPEQVRRALEDAGLTSFYTARPAYQQNDYIAWITRAKRQETYNKRLAQMLDELRAGNVYMRMQWNG